MNKESVNKYIYEGELEAIGNLEETKVFLNYILLNKDYIIRERTNYVANNNRTILNAIAIILCFIFSIAIGINFFIPFMKFSTLFGTAIGTIGGTLSLRIIKEIKAKRKITKEVNNNIKSIQESLSKQEENLKQIEVMRNLVKEAEEQKESSLDSFIKMVRDDMFKISDIKYTGYGSDLQRLFDLAVSYLEEKEKLGTVSDAYTLTQDSKWFKELNMIEAQITQKSKVQEDQNLNKEILLQLRGLIGDIKENEDKKEDDDSLKLTL